MDQDRFTREYFSLLASKLAPHGYEPKMFIKGVLAGVDAMIKNDNSRSNEQVFWSTFAELFGDRVYGDIGYFDEFYKNDFDSLKKCCSFDGGAADTVRHFKDRGYKLVLASNPVFPVLAQKKRCRWAGIDPDVFDYITSYENSGYCKPDPLYYTQIAENIGLDPAECLMAGNDATEDLVAENVGMKVFLLTDGLINTKNRDISLYPQGEFDMLIDYADTL